MENRIVFCADCDTSRLLAVSSSGSLICSSCGSKNWMHRSAPLASRLKAYDEHSIEENLAIERYLNHLEKEIFSSSNGRSI